MSDIIEILKLAKDAVTSFAVRRHATTEEAWGEVVIALEKLVELTTLHTKAIAEVTSPILESGDIAETSRRYSLLTNNPDFPLGYGDIRGVLEATQKLKAFQNSQFQEKVSAVLDKLHNFQYGAFRLDWDSYQIADAFEGCALLLTAKQPASSEKIAEVAKPFINSMSGLFSEANQPDIENPTTLSELINLLKTWCTSWQRYVQQTLYRGRGLNYTISQLKMQHFA